MDKNELINELKGLAKLLRHSAKSNDFGSEFNRGMNSGIDVCVDYLEKLVRDVEKMESRNG